MMPLIIDTHCHFDADDNAPALLEDAMSMNVRVIAVGGGEANNQTAIHSGAPFACGYDWSSAGCEIALTVYPKMLAVGEIGFDFHRGYSPEIELAQRNHFIPQAEFAREHQLPIIVHTREADRVTEEVLADVALPRTGVIHSFTGDISFARRLLDLGYFISFSGIVTFRNAEMLRETAKFVPSDRILVETDSPYLAPVPLRGKRNRPAYVRETAKFLAALRGVTLDVFAEQTRNNTQQLFGSISQWEA